MANSRVIPGAIENDLLWLGNDHRAHRLFHNNMPRDAVLDIKRSDQPLWHVIKAHPIPDRVMRYIRAAGLGGVFDCGYKLLDHSLITSLVERWRPETHTFHFSFGETTVTLQDVQVMWGLQVSGDVVTGKERKWSYEMMSPMCQQLLGVAPEAGHFRAGKIRTAFLYRELERLPLSQDASDDACKQRARLYMFILLGRVLFADKSDGYIHMCLLTLIEDLQKCSKFSWGSAVLACLYRNLCKATSPDAGYIAGPLMLLQLWAWCRLPCTAPIGPKFVVDPNNRMPYGSRWKCSLEFGDTARYCLSVYRERFDALQENEYFWTPYEHAMSSLPSICTQDQLDWLCDTFIIFWEIVEVCQPSRVMRQFNFIQRIPPNPQLRASQHTKLHKSSRSGAASRDWAEHYAQYITSWEQRSPSIGVFSNFPTTTPDYMGWYWPRTVLLIRNPGVVPENSYRFSNLGGTVELAVDGFSRMHQGMGEMMQTNQSSQPYLRPWYDMTQQYLHLTHADDRMNYRSTHVVDASAYVPDSPPEMHDVQRARRRRRGRRGGDRQEQQQQEHQQQGENQGQEQGYGVQENQAGTSNQNAPISDFASGSGSHFASGSGSHFASGSGIREFPQHNLYDFDPSYQYITPPQNLSFHSPGSSNYLDLFGECYRPLPTTFDANPNTRINSPVPFANFDGDIDINLSLDPGFEVQQEEEEEEQQQQQQQQQQRRPRRIIRPPACGTGGRLGHGHNH